MKLKEIIADLEQADQSFDYAKRTGYNADNWHLNAHLCVEHALTKLRAIKVDDGLYKATCVAPGWRTKEEQSLVDEAAKTLLGMVSDEI